MNKRRNSRRRINGEKEQRIPEVFSLEGEVQTSHDEI
jgi:hypothetical protein